MKKIILSVWLIISIFTFGFSQENEETVEINPKTGFPEIVDKPFLMYNEGFSYGQVTRIEKQSGRTNFGWEDFMIGIYFSLQTGNIKPFDLTLRTQVFYPFSHTFQGQKMFAKQTILYAFDIFAGPTFQFDFWKYLRLNLTPGLHYMYQLSDEYHLNYVGIGGIVGLELPVSRHCNILLDGTFNLDYPNFGSNQKIQVFNYSWQYQFSVGFRYSLANPNKYSYIQTQNDKLINAGLIEDPVIVKRRQKENLRKARALERKELKEKMRYMTTGEKALLKKQIKQDHKVQKEALKQEKIEQKQKLLETKKIYEQDQKLIKEIRKKEKLQKAEEKKQIQLEHKAKLEELKIRQQKEDELKKQDKINLEAQKAAEKSRKNAEKNKTKIENVDSSKDAEKE